MTTTFIALLRGVNVGGKNKLPMKDLGGMFAAAGCGAGRTYIQSGNVLFLADTPSQDRIDGLDAHRSPPDAFLVRGGEIFLNCPNGVARTKLTNTYFDAKLATVSTGRNWRTVTKLLELTGRQKGAS